MPNSVPLAVLAATVLFLRVSVPALKTPPPWTPPPPVMVTSSRLTVPPLIVTTVRRTFPAIAVEAGAVLARAANRDVAVDRDQFPVGPGCDIDDGADGKLLVATASTASWMAA